MVKEFSKLLRKSSEKKKIGILMVGLDNAGKTTILDKLKYNKTVITTPTIGFNVETFEYKNITFSVWNIGGQAKVRNLWRNNYSNIQGVIYVVDSSDRDRVDEARDELKSMLEGDELKNTALIIFANKMDLPNAMSSSELAQKLELTTFQEPWFIQHICITPTEVKGVYEGLHWLIEKLLTN